MNEQLEEIKEAVASGEIDTARTLSDQYVSANPDAFSGWEAKEVDGEQGLVAAVDTYRATGMEDDQWKVEAWLLHRFNPQNIGGAAIVTIRVPDNG